MRAVELSQKKKRFLKYLIFYESRIIILKQLFIKEIKMKVNITKNQHYISRVEQKLNSCTPKAHPSYRKIYKFKIENRDNFEVSFVDEVNIKDNLCDNDLFTYQFIDEKRRANFESFFERYEKSIEHKTNFIINADSSTNQAPLLAAIKKVYAAKMVNYVRNPFNIEKTLNNFSTLNNYSYPSKNFKKTIEKIYKLEGNNIQERCKSYKVSHRQYKDWLVILFTLLHDNSRLMKSFIDEILTQYNHHQNIFMIKNDFEKCILSDRGVCSYVNGAHSFFEVNLTDQCFIIFVSTNILDTEQYKNPLNQDYFNKAIRTGIMQYECNKLMVIPIDNNIDLLKSFNQRSLYHSHSHIYCSSKNIMGLNIS